MLEKTFYIYEVEYVEVRDAAPGDPLFTKQKKVRVDIKLEAKAARMRQVTEYEERTVSATAPPPAAAAAAYSVKNERIEEIVLN